MKVAVESIKINTNRFGWITWRSCKGSYKSCNKKEVENKRNKMGHEIEEVKGFYVTASYNIEQGSAKISNNPQFRCNWKDMKHHEDYTRFCKFNPKNIIICCC